MKMPNKLNIRIWIYAILGIAVSFFSYTFYVEFDKMQIPYKRKYSNISICIRFVWRRPEFAFLCVASAAHFLCSLGE